MTRRILLILSAIVLLACLFGYDQNTWYLSLRETGGAVPFYPQSVTATTYVDPLACSAITRGKVIYVDLTDNLKEARMCFCASASWVQAADPSKSCFVDEPDVFWGDGKPETKDSEPGTGWGDGLP